MDEKTKIAVVALLAGIFTGGLFTYFAMKPKSTTLTITPPVQPGGQAWGGFEASKYIVDKSAPVQTGRNIPLTLDEIGEVAARFGWDPGQTRWLQWDLYAVTGGSITEAQMIHSQPLPAAIVAVDRAFQRALTFPYHRTGQSLMEELYNSSSGDTLRNLPAYPREPQGMPPEILSVGTEITPAELQALERTVLAAGWPREKILWLFYGGLGGPHNNMYSVRPADVLGLGEVVHPTVMQAVTVAMQVMENRVVAMASPAQRIRSLALTPLQWTEWALDIVAAREGLGRWPPLLLPNLPSLAQSRAP